MKKLIAATLFIISISVLSVSSNASSPPSTDSGQPQESGRAAVSANAWSQLDAPSADPAQPQPLFQLGVCSLTCESCVIGSPCPRDPETGHSQVCVSNCP
jgi:hypothetical protein